MEESFFTVYQNSECTISEKKSKFISFAAPIQSEIEAQTIIEYRKKQHFNANHNVFAYQISNKNIIKRYTDDGEPSGTAGMPILGILEAQNLINVIVIVTRYFGGTLLGTGGLVKAYSKSAKLAIEQAIIIEKVLYQKLSIKIDYNLLGKIQFELLNNNTIIIDTIYTDIVEFIVLVENIKTNFILNLIKEITSATIVPTLLGKNYVALINNQVKIF